MFNPRIILLPLILGAVTTVLVAWLINLFAELGDLPLPPLDKPSLQAWPVAVPEGWPAPTISDRQPRFGLVSINAAHHVSKHLGYQVQVRRAGWPFAALQSATVVTFDSARGKGDAAWRLHHSFWQSGPRIGTSDFLAGPEAHLPIRPVAPGFIADTVIYGALAGLVMHGVRALRARRREPTPPA